ncbi:hypothetical protein B0H13DRAFT_1917017 [Mycena leptocephala]|nr:hypothetical protein B0H13DRAFT_1917017 [Mycena leptocephala]
MTDRKTARAVGGQTHHRKNNGEIGKPTIDPKGCTVLSNGRSRKGNVDINCQSHHDQYIRQFWRAHQHVTVTARPPRCNSPLQIDQVLDPSPKSIEHNSPYLRQPCTQKPAEPTGYVKHSTLLVPLKSKMLPDPALVGGAWNTRKMSDLMLETAYTLPARANGDGEAEPLPIKVRAGLGFVGGLSWNLDRYAAVLRIRVGYKE